MGLLKAIAVVLAVGLGVYVGSVAGAGQGLSPGDPQGQAFVALSIGGEFTHDEYHGRVRDQIERLGYEDVCVSHLSGVDYPHHASGSWLDATEAERSSARNSIEVQLEECRAFAVDRYSGT